MENIIEILNSHFKILQVAIENFTILDRDLEIHIKIHSTTFGIRTIIFDHVSNININSKTYVCSDKSSIIIEDLSAAQLEGVTYQVAIAEDAMTFYCRNIILNNECCWH